MPSIPSVASLFAMVFFFASAPVAAQLVVDRTVLEFSPETRAQTVIVGNSGDQAMYVTTELNESLDPESAEPTLQSYTDPRTAPVIANPRTMLLQPGQRKQLRLLVKAADVDKDRIYKLKVKPYIDKVTLNQPVDSRKRSALKVSVGYNLLLIQRPADPKAEVSVERRDGAIVFANAGNTNVLLKDIRQCDSAGQMCEELGTNRLYAGEELRIDLPKPGGAEQYPVQVKVFSHDGMQERSY